MVSITDCRLFSSIESLAIRWGVGLILIDRLSEQMMFIWCLISGMKYCGNEVLRGIEITGTNLVKASCKISARVDHMELPQSARLLLLWKLWKSACCRNSSS